MKTLNTIYILHVGNNKVLKSERDLMNLALFKAFSAVSRSERVTWERRNSIRTW